MQLLIIFKLGKSVEHKRLKLSTQVLLKQLPFATLCLVSLEISCDSAVFRPSWNPHTNSGEDNMRRVVRPTQFLFLYLLVETIIVCHNVKHFMLGVSHGEVQLYQDFVIDY